MIKTKIHIASLLFSLTATAQNYSSVQRGGFNDCETWEGTTSTAPYRVELCRFVFPVTNDWDITHQRFINDYTDNVPSNCMDGRGIMKN
jgi:hypothetical protein